LFRSHYSKQVRFNSGGDERTFLLQAESDVATQDWVDSLQSAIGRALNSDHSADHVTKGLHGKEKLDHEFFEADAMVSQARREANSEMLEALERIQALPGNQKCADCSAESTFLISLRFQQFCFSRGFN
jgi:hypothetical protein